MGDDRRSNVGGYPLGPGPEEEIEEEKALPDRMRELRTQTLRDREPPPTERDLDREAETREDAEREREAEAREGGSRTSR